MNTNNLPNRTNNVEELLSEVRLLVEYGENALLENRLTMQCKEDAGYGEEYCVHSTLHRGYYHPSPVYDLLVGNTKRGRIIALSKAAANVSHHYFYDRHGQLEWIETISQNKITHVERLFWGEEQIMGVTVDCRGNLSAITEERYACGKINSFKLANCYHNGQTYVCFNYRAEYFYYDELGLKACRLTNLSPISGQIINKLYQFERKDGYLVSFSNSETGASSNNRYQIKKRRKA